MTLGQIARAANGTLTGTADPVITSITTDSRKACEGSLFACIKGENSDGHDYAPSAASLGASAVLCERPIPDPGIPVLTVENTVEALGNIAAAMLELSGIPVLAVAGSVGKTSTKELTAMVLSRRLRVLKTEANFNNELGLPLTVFRLQPEDEAAVLELGIDDFGQMHRLARIARPTVGIFTNIGDCHLENLGDRPGVFRAKTEMFDHLRPGGRVVLNGDDELLRKVQEVNGFPPVFYGLSEQNDYRAADIEKTEEGGSRFTILMPDASVRTEVSLPGEHMIRNALAAAAAGRLLGISPEEIAEGIRAYRTIDGRFNILKTGRFTVIDDCYNANPMSMKAALASLAGFRNGRKIAILGDMGELGEQSARLHYETGLFAGKQPIDAVLTVGEESREIIRGAVEAAGDPGLRTECFAAKEELFKWLPDFLRDGDVLLVKASHFMGFSEIVGWLKDLP